MARSGESCKAIPTCKSYLELTPDKLHCCWADQEWDGKQCSGTPDCPDGYGRTGQTCKRSPTCSTGKVLTGDKLHCCWPGQKWDGQTCSGQPSADSGYWEKVVKDYGASVAALDKTGTTPEAAKKVTRDGEALIQTWPKLAPELSPFVDQAWKRHWELEVERRELVVAEKQAKYQAALATYQTAVDEQQSLRRWMGAAVAGETACLGLMIAGLSRPDADAIGMTMLGASMVGGVVIGVVSMDLFLFESESAKTAVERTGKELDEADVALSEAKSELSRAVETLEAL